MLVCFNFQHFYLPTYLQKERLFNDAVISLKSVVFQTGFLRTLVFREGVSGVPRSALESLRILYDVLIISPTCFYNNIKI
jgi:hypothetical protein